MYAAGILLTSLSAIEDAIRASWSADTCDPVDLPWSENNPAKGQCSVTALVLNDLVGGELLLAEVHNPDGSRQGVHYWNRLPGGQQIDLTREQFRAGETISEPRVVPLPENRNEGWLASPYRNFSEAVQRALPAPD